MKGFRLQFDNSIQAGISEELTIFHGHIHQFVLIVYLPLKNMGFVN